MSQMSHQPKSAPTPEMLLQLVIEKVTPIYELKDKWHGLIHVKRVVEWAKQINAIEKADPFLVEVGAWLHQLHAPNLEKLEAVLNAIPFSRQQRDALNEIVAQCRPDTISENASKAAQVVFDADAKELLGLYGIEREVQCNIEFRKMPSAQAHASAKEVQELFASKLQTNAAKQMFQEEINQAKGYWKALQREEAQLPDSILRIF